MKHHPNLELNVICFEDESERVRASGNTAIRKLGKSNRLAIYRRDEKGIRNGYKTKSHLGTARAWANIIHSYPSKFYIHLDSDQIFLGDLLTEVIEKLKFGFDVVGTRRPYFHRGYRKEGRDGAYLDLRQDAVNTDLMGISRRVIGNLWSPIAVRKIRGRRTTLKPVVDFFDPVFFSAIKRGCTVFYLDSDNQNPVGQSNKNSKFYNNRLVFAAVGSGANFWVNPESTSSPGYREYALQSYSLWRKWIEHSPIPYKTLEAPELESRLIHLDQQTWTLKSDQSSY
jgi:hypothetical protein